MAHWRNRLTVALLLAGNLAMVAGCAGQAGQSFTGPSAPFMTGPGMSGGLILPYTIGPGMGPIRR